MRLHRMLPQGFWSGLGLTFLSSSIFFGAGMAAEGVPQAPFAQRDHLFEQAMAVLPEHKRPAGLHIQVSDYEPRTCATLILEQVRQNLQDFSPEQQRLFKSLFQRPELPESYVSSSGAFKIHYTRSGIDAVPAADADQNGVPDFVEETAAAYELSFEVQVNELGYDAPPDDDGTDGPEYDVYIQDLGPSFYGYTQGEAGVPETPQRDLRSYIVIDNDFEDGHFTPGIDGSRVTAAHEYFHAVQFGYRTFNNSDEPFYYEMCSVWMEDVLYDDINDYYQYLPSYFRKTNVPFNKFDLSRSFGQAVWNHFIVKKYDRADMIRTSWELMRAETSAMAAIQESLSRIGGTFSNDFVEFGFWNYFTGSRADSIRFYKESAAYSEVLIDDAFLFTADTTVIDSSLSLTHKYYEVTVPEAGAYSITGDFEDPGKWLVGVITVAPGGDTNLFTVNPIIGQNLGTLPAFSTVVIIPSNLQILEGADRSLLSSERLTFRFNLMQGALAETADRGVMDIYPNPFRPGLHDEQWFIFNIEPNRVTEVRIFSADGRLIRFERLPVNTSFFAWDGRDDDNAPVASGVYLVQMRQGNLIDARKFAIVR